MHPIAAWSRELMNKFLYDPGPIAWREAVGLVPTHSESPFLYQVRNAIIRSKGRGSDAWVKNQLSCARILDYPALHPIIGIPGQGKSQLPVNKMMKKYGQAKLYGCDETVQRLEALPNKYLSFVSATLDIVGSPDLADKCADKTLAKFIRRLKRCFPHSKGFFVVEVKPVIVRNQPIGVLADARWKDQWGSNQIVFKVHVHGFLYAPYVQGHTELNHD